MFIRIDGNPIALKRPKISGKYMYNPQCKIRDAFALQTKTQINGSLPFKNPIEIQLEFHMPIPKSLSKKKKEALISTPHIKKPDLSNLIKFVEDALNGILWSDDKIIYLLTSKKIYSLNPKTLIYVQETEK